MADWFFTFDVVLNCVQLFYKYLANCTRFFPEVLEKSFWSVAMDAHFKDNTQDFLIPDIVSNNAFCCPKFSKYHSHIQ